MPVNDIDRARMEGEAANSVGDLRESCPYEFGATRIAWLEGWDRFDVEVRSVLEEDLYYRARFADEMAPVSW